MTQQVRTRFAPSPTGMLHIGNTRTAIINWLYARKNQGQFYLRFDDTDLLRSREEYKEAIKQDLEWLGLTWDKMIVQSSRIERYTEIKNKLIEQGSLYPCFETKEELEIKRKLQLANNKPPIYDRAGLKLSPKQIEGYLERGRKPHYRFFVEDGEIEWQDIIKDEMRYKGSNIGDPIVIREDGTMTYMLCSVIDDIDYEITDILRGEDHLTNTATQVVMFKILGAITPNLGHLNLIKAKEEKISKRVGGFEIADLRNKALLEAMTINSFFATIGSSMPVSIFKNLTDLTDQFNISRFSKNATTYLADEMKRLNCSLIASFTFTEVQPRLKQIGLDQVDEKFWNIVKNNLKTLNEVQEWWQILNNPKKIVSKDQDFLNLAASLLPDEIITTSTWDKWIAEINKVSDKRGKELFLPLRLAITGVSHGPELKNILPLIGREEVSRRLLSIV